MKFPWELSSDFTVGVFLEIERLFAEFITTTRLNATVTFTYKGQTWIGVGTFVVYT